MLASHILCKDGGAEAVPIREVRERTVLQQQPGERKLRLGWLSKYGKMQRRAPFGAGGVDVSAARE